MSTSRPAWIGWLGAVGLAALLAGCHGAPPPCAAPAGPELPEAARGTTELDLSAVPRLDPAYRPTLLKGRNFRSLTAHECQCLAAQNASLAEMLGEGSDGKHTGADSCLPCARKIQLVLSVQTYAAEDARNRAAGTALEAYYRLAEAEGRAELLSDSQAEVDALLAVAEELYAKKLLDKSELDAAQRQSADLVADTLRLQIAVDQLNATLRVLLGVRDSCDDWSIWPAGPLRVTPTTKTPEEYVAFGLEHRPDIALLRTVHDGLTKATLPVVRQFLAGINPLLAMKPGGPILTLLMALKECLCGDQLAKVHRQIETMLREHERQAAEEIRQSAREVEVRLWLVSAAEQRVKDEQRKLEEVKEKQGRDLASAADVRRAALNVLKARRDLLSEVVNWNIADSQLRQRLGVLAQECDGACGAETNASASSDCDHKHPVPSR